MKILVIGASGLLAKPVIRHFNKADFKLRLFSRNVTPSMFDGDYEIIQGDVYNIEDLKRGIDGCDAVHISLSSSNESEAVKKIVDISKKLGIKLISYISGCTVAKENRWFPMIEHKFQAEQSIINSDIPYLIFRPTWFFETLDLMIRDGKAMQLGRQKNPSHWLAADDLARMVVTAYKKTELRNKIFYILGPDKYLMKDLLEKYCKYFYPEIKKVKVIPIWMVKIMAGITGRKELKSAASLFAYFEKVKEQGYPDEANALLGKPEITFEKWTDIKIKQNLERT